MQPIHHYVPRFLLKNFCTGKKPRLWVFDKARGVAFQANVQKIGGERRFYETTIGEKVLSLESTLALLETHASKVIKRIIDARNLSMLTPDDRATVALFVAVQMVRVPHQRENLLALDKALQKTFHDRGIDASQIENYQALTPETAKFVSMLALMSPEPYAQHILDKTWLLFETKPSVPFCISDNPVVLQNLRRRGPQGNLGIAVLGIEIYLPISRTLSLGFYCRSHEAEVRAGVEKYHAALAQKPTLPIPAFGPVLDLFNAMTKGTALGSQPENVENQNSLQIRHAERFIFSSLPDFELAKSMISKQPRYKSGPRPEVAR
jgi:Protein of unknown function (DUF4238)